MGGFGLSVLRDRHLGHINGKAPGVKVQIADADGISLKPGVDFLFSVTPQWLIDEETKQL